MWPSGAEAFEISFIATHIAPRFGVKKMCPVPASGSAKSSDVHRYGLYAALVNSSTLFETWARTLIRPIIVASALLLPTPAMAACIQGLSGSPTVLALGDSLTAGYGLDEGLGFVNVMEERLQASGLHISVTNAGVSGDTSTGGRNRLPWTLDGMADASIVLVIVELGANDALRGIDPSVTRANIDAILETLTRANCQVLLTGMMSPPNLGIEYGAEFGSIYPDMAEKHGVTLYPFFLDGVAADQNLNQGDGIHPNEEGVRIVVERMLPFVRALLNPPDPAS